MSYMLAHLFNGWQVDQAILSEEDRVVVSFSSFTKININFHHHTLYYYTIKYFIGYSLWSRLGSNMYENG